MGCAVQLAKRHGLLPGNCLQLRFQVGTWRTIGDGNLACQMRKIIVLEKYVPHSAQRPGRAVHPESGIAYSSRLQRKLLPYNVEKTAIDYVFRYRQGYFHGIDRRGPQDRRDPRRSDRPLHARAGRQITGGRIR